MRKVLTIPLNETSGAAWRRRPVLKSLARNSGRRLRLASTAIILVSVVIGGSCGGGGIGGVSRLTGGGSGVSTGGGILGSGGSDGGGNHVVKGGGKFGRTFTLGERSDLPGASISGPAAVNVGFAPDLPDLPDSPAFKHTPARMTRVASLAAPLSGASDLPFLLSGGGSGASSGGGGNGSGGGSTGGGHTGGGSTDGGTIGGGDSTGGGSTGGGVGGSGGTDGGGSGGGNPFPPPPPSPGVPEPATWALMTLGVTVLGAALRRRRRVDPVRSVVA